MQCLLMPMLLRTEERDCKKKGKRASDIRWQIIIYFFNYNIMYPLISSVAKGNLGEVNPLVPELPVTEHADPRPFFHLCWNQFYCSRTTLSTINLCREKRPFNHTTMSMIQLRAPKKKAKNHETLTWKFPWKSCSTTDQPFLSSDPIKDPTRLCKNFSHQKEAY